MGAFIKYRVPYEVTVKGVDAASGKDIANVFYYRCGVQAVAPPAYGTDIPNTDTDFFASALRLDAWNTDIFPLMSVNYHPTQWEVKEITGWTTLGPAVPIQDASNATPIQITTVNPHGLLTGQSVTVSGAAGNTAANGAWVVTKVNNRTFTLNGSGGNGAYVPFSGVFSVSVTAPRFTYGGIGIYESITGFGTVAGDAIQLVSTMSVRKLTPNAGRKWRGGTRWSPIAESDNVNGTCTDARHAIRVANLEHFRATGISTLAGGGGANQENMFLGFVSKNLAFSQPTPFTTDATWFAFCSAYLPRQNEGILRRRKPKLTAPIIH